MAEKICKTDKQLFPCIAQKRQKKKEIQKEMKKITAPRYNAFKSRVVPSSPIVSP